MARKEIVDIIEELKSWLPNYDHGPNDYPTLLWRILASTPGGEEAEDMGYEPFGLGWHEVDQLGRVLTAIQDKRDVEDLIRGLLAEEQEEVQERRRPDPRVHPRHGRPIPKRSAPPPPGPARRAPPPRRAAPPPPARRRPR